MAQRLTATEMALLAADTRRTPQQVSSVDIFAVPAPAEAAGDGRFDADAHPAGRFDADAHPAGRFDADHIAALIEERLDFVPKYRMRVRQVPGGIAAPVWVEDESFDPGFHIRRSALPRPGTDQQLDEFVGRVTARELDLDRPLWECYIVEGLAPEEGTGRERFAVITKSHLCLVDGVDAVELGQVVLDEAPGDPDPEDSDPGDSDPGDPAGRRFAPLPEPRPVDLIIDAIREGLAGPGQALEVGRRGLTSALSTAVAAGESIVGGGSVGEWAQVALRGHRGPIGTPFGGVPSEQRRFARTALPMAELRDLRVGRYTLNDVLLTVVAGGLRGWLAAQGRHVRELLALVPMSVMDSDGQPSALGSHVAPHLIALPLAEPNPLMRLHQISHGTRAHTDTGQSVSARMISDIAGFAPMTLHALGVRAGEELVLRPHHLLVTNAPGPQHPMWLAGAPMVASHPIVPIEPGRLVSIGLTSYDGTVFVGINTDRARLPEPALLASCIDDAVGELRAAIDDEGGPDD